MTGTSLNAPEQPRRSRHSQVEMSPLLNLLQQQDEALRSLFATALNLHVSPGAEALPTREKHDRLKQAIEASLRAQEDPC